MKDLNDKRLADLASDEKHVAILTLETVLGQLNDNQGLGFVLFGTVLDKRYFFGLLIRLGAVAATVQTTLLAFRHDELTNAASGGSTGCGSLSTEQQAAFKTFARDINATCTWSLTIGPAGVIVN